jgi:assimilatory nitrate reductase electron transfer subunit
MRSLRAPRGWRVRMKHVVVIGHGMVGARFAEELLEADPHVRITVLGKESTPAYNRVLLSSVVAGSKSAAMLSLGGEDHPRMRVLTRVAATQLRVDDAVVIDDHGESHAYDELVLATGSVARVPAIHGVANPDGLVPGAFVLKDMADADGIVAASAHARRAVVLGAGVLGLEVATGLVGRGVAVRLVHMADRVMDRQLGWEASAVATQNLSRLGIETHVGASVSALRSARGKVAAVRLEDGTEVPADMLVMCCGTVPETSLARTGGLAVDRGIVVDDHLRTSAPHIYAIGDCAQPPEGGTGLVAQGWEQATRLVRTICGSPATDSVMSARDVVRVKAIGIDMVAMGVCGDFDREDPRYRVLSLKDPEGGRYVEVVVTGGRLAGATCVGDADVAAALSALYTRHLPVPADPAHLLIRAMGGGMKAVASDPADLADDDPVCTCNAVTAGGIRTAVSGGCRSIADVAGQTRATTGCGGCAGVVAALISQHDEAAAVAASATNGVRI